MINQIDISGINEVKLALDKLDRRLASSLLAKALRMGAAPISKAAKRLAYPATESYRISRGTYAGYYMPGGRLRKSIGVTVVKRYPPVAYVGPERGAGKKYDAYYAHWVEWGRWKSYKDRILPRPYMRPAWDMNKRNSVDIITKYLKAELQKWV